MTWYETKGNIDFYLNELRAELDPGKFRNLLILQKLNNVIFETIIYNIYIHIIIKHNNIKDIPFLLHNYKESLGFSGSVDTALLDSLHSFDLDLGSDFLPLNMNCIDTIGTGEGSSYCGVKKVIGYIQDGTHVTATKFCKKLVCPACGTEKIDQDTLDSARQLWDFHTLHPEYRASYFEVSMDVPCSFVSSDSFRKFISRTKKSLKSAGFLIGYCVPTFRSLKPEVKYVLGSMGYIEAGSYHAACSSETVDVINEICGSNYRSWRDLHNFRPVLQVVAFHPSWIDCDSLGYESVEIDLSGIDGLVDNVIFANSRECVYNVPVTKFQSRSWFGARGAGIIEEAEEEFLKFKGDPAIGKLPTPVQSLVVGSMRGSGIDTRKLHVGVFVPVCQDTRSPYEKFPDIESVEHCSVVPWGRFIVRRRFEPGLGWVYNREDEEFNSEYIRSVKTETERARMFLEIRKLNSRWQDSDIDILNKSLPLSEVPRFSDSDRVKCHNKEKASWLEYLDLFGYRDRVAYSSVVVCEVETEVKTFVPDFVKDSYQLDFDHFDSEGVV